MAGEWIKFEANTPEKPEVFAITVALGWDDPDLTVGKLLKVWRWFDQHTINGNAGNVTFALLDRVSGVTGFAQAMCDVGWIIKTEDGICLPHFDRHNGKTAKDRALTAKRVANHKAKAKEDGEGNGAGVTGALPKEEKRRSKNIPHTPQAGQKPERKAISLQTYLDECKESEAKPIPEDDPVFTYADEIGLPHDFLRLQWLEFRDRYSQPGAKRYKAWATVFSKSVRGNWFKLWYSNGDGYELTTTGQQAKKIHKGKA